MQNFQNTVDFLSASDCPQASHGIFVELEVAAATPSFAIRFHPVGQCVSVSIATRAFSQSIDIHCRRVSKSKEMP